MDWRVFVCDRASDQMTVLSGRLTVVHLTTSLGLVLSEDSDDVF